MNNVFSNPDLKITAMAHKATKAQRTALFVALCLCVRFSSIVVCVVHGCLL